MSLFYFSMGSLEEQLSKCVRVRALVAYNPRPKFYTINTTRDSRNRERNILVSCKDLGLLLPYRFPVAIHLMVSKEQSNRYDAEALSSVINNCGLDKHSLPLWGSNHTEEDSRVEVFALCLATSSDSEVKLATKAVYKMKNFLQSSLHTDLVGISSMKLHADPVLVESPPNGLRYDLSEDFVVPEKENLFQSTTKQGCYINQCLDPFEGGWLADIRFLFGGFQILFDVRFF